MAVRLDYFCFHPHQVYTTLLALEKCDMSSGTLGFCKTDLELDGYNN
jgi:hypothetical protein